MQGRAVQPSTESRDYKNIRLGGRNTVKQSRYTRARKVEGEAYCQQKEEQRVVTKNYIKKSGRLGSISTAAHLAAQLTASVLFGVGNRRTCAVHDPDLRTLS